MTHSNAFLGPGGDPAEHFENSEAHGSGQVLGMNSGRDCLVLECPELGDVPSVERILRCVTRDCTADPDRDERGERTTTGRSENLE